MQGPIQHRVERTSNKHSRAVYKDNTIVIRLARGLSNTQEQEHVDSLLRRMHRMVLKERERTSVDPFQPLLRGASSLYLELPSGQSHLFTLAAGERSRATKTADGWHIVISRQIRRRTLHRFLWTLLAKYEQPRVEALVREINSKTFRAPIRSVRLRYASTQWGSCSARGVIMLNAVLLFLPERLLRYVIAHELAHMRVRNHSEAFWRTVGLAEPQYQELRHELQKYRICSL